MPRQLTQEELGALLAPPAAPERVISRTRRVPTPDVRGYDFARPARLSRDESRTLQLIHESFAHRLGSTLSAMLRSSVSVSASEMEEVAYGDFVQNLADPTLVAVFEIPPHAIRALLQMNVGLALAVVDRLLGGKGEAPDTPRPLTEIEQMLLRGLVTRLLGDYAGTWRPLVRFDPHLETMVCDNIFAHIALPSEVVCVGRFEIVIGDTHDHFTLCLPAQAMESVFVRLDLQAWLSAGHAVSTQSDEMQRQLGQVRVTTHVPLGAATISLRDLLGLEVGDIVRLDTRTTSELPVLVADRIKFMGKPGMVDGRMGIQIRREAQPGEDS